MTDTTIALISGANKGIGYEIARQLGATGTTILLGARDRERGEAATAKLIAEGVTARFVPLDVTDAASISAATKSITDGYPCLDVLINNAGILADRGAPSGISADTFRRTYETNVFGAVALIQAMLPLLRASAAGRIVNLSSELGSLGRCTTLDSMFSQHPLLAYGSSKSALNAVTVAFANELRDTPIKVNAADPGYCATDLNGHSGPRTAAQGAAIAVHLATLGPDGPTGAFLNDEGTTPW